MASTGRKQSKKTKHAEDSTDIKSFDFALEDEKTGLSWSEDDIREGN